MKNLTTPQAILFGLGMIALAIASVPYSSNIVAPAYAGKDAILRIAICDELGWECADIHSGGLEVKAD